MLSSLRLLSTFGPDYWQVRRSIMAQDSWLHLAVLQNYSRHDQAAEDATWTASFASQATFFSYYNGSSHDEKLLEWLPPISVDNEVKVLRLLRWLVHCT